MRDWIAPLLDAPGNLAVRRAGAAVDGKVGAVDEARICARQEDDSRRDPLGVLK